MIEDRENVFLDNALRCLYNAFRSKRNGLLLAIEFTHRGKKWRADTPEEAIVLRETLENEDKAEVFGNPFGNEQLLYAETKWTPDRFYELVQSIGPLQKKFLGVLLGADYPIEADDVRKKMALPSLLSLAGVQAKLVRQVRVLGLEPTDLYQVHIDWSENERKRFLMLDKGFRLVARDEQWPPSVIASRKGVRMPPPPKENANSKSR